ncbi:hypothetical protein EJB05_49352, partial [Eragrostis curvula]
MISDLRKTRQRVSYAAKAGDARYPNPFYWGKLCFMSTPDGENCGLVKNLAATVIVSSKPRTNHINIVHSKIEQLFSPRMATEVGLAISGDPLLPHGDLLLCPDDLPNIED